MESLETQLHNQKMEIDDLKHQLFMLKLELDKVALQTTLNDIGLNSLERRHESLLTFSVGLSKIK